jgi:hypothetical protein
MSNGNDQRVIVINRAVNVEAEEPLPVTAPIPLPVSGAVSASVTSYPPQRYEYRVFLGATQPPFLRVPLPAFPPGAQATPQDIARSLEIWFNEGFEIHFVDPTGVFRGIVVLRRPIG